LFRLRRLTAIAALLLACAAAPAQAQTVVVVVNGDPVTNFDVEQRSKLISLATQKPPPRQQVIEELIDEKLKVQMLRRFAIEGIDKDVDTAFANMARRMRATPRQFAENLEKQGVKAETLKSRMKAEIVWSQIIRGRYQSAFQFSEADIKAKVQAKQGGDVGPAGHDYTLRPILFVVPRGSPQSLMEARMKEAEGLRSRFQGCDQGLPMARAIGSVAVRAPIVRGSADFSPALREVLAKTEVGRLTPPEVTTEGIQLYAVCSKKDSDTTPAEKEMRDTMYQEAFETHSKRLLKELRSQAMIEYR
jgi:peptidyl-prolyl cis-trans isomerase SurA